MCSRFSIPSAVLKTLLCSNCENYLSIFPIHMAENSGVLCGRCNVTEGEKITRIEPYEHISQFLEFPCMYSSRGCDYSLTPTKMKEHEPFCEYRQFIINCPNNKSSLECQWKGTKPEMIQHFEQNHGHSILKEPSFEVNFLNSQKEHLLLQQNDEWFIINNKVESSIGMFSCSIEHIKMNENAPTPKYFLHFQNANKDYCHKCPEKSACDNEMLNSTHLIYDMFHESLKDSATVTINIQINLNTTGEDQKKPDIKEEKNTYCDLLVQLKCPNCEGYMLPPIFQCIYGHSICSMCKSEVDNACPVCKNRIEKTRNFALENLTDHVKYPCKFYELGCKYSCEPTYIKEHEEYCEFRPFICPLNICKESCNRKENLVQLLEHIEDDHSCMIHRSSLLGKRLLAKPGGTVYLIKFRKSMFRVHYQKNFDEYYWHVNYIGPDNESKNYKFAVEIIGLSNSVTYCCITGLVQLYTQNKEWYDEPLCHGNYVVLHTEQLEAFPKGLLYNIRVFQGEKW